MLNSSFLIQSINFSRIDSDFLPSSVAPVLVLHNNLLKFTPMRFSLVPHWSSEPKVKFATHNARIETVIEKPTWKIPFKAQHCLVPITNFYESVYEGPIAGHIIKFNHVADKTLWAAGLFDYWQEPGLGQASFFSFSILTQDPSEFILKNGHDRTPIFLSEEAGLNWLKNVKADPETIRRELVASSYHPDLKVEIERPLKPGWEKRI